MDLSLDVGCGLTALMLAAHRGHCECESCAAVCLSVWPPCPPV
jgi:hypothetical protein